MRKITLKDIAKELGVTVGTVSHALNGLDDISPKMKAQVFETAKRLGYIQNSSAASLRSGKTKTVAIIIPDVSNPHIAYQVKLIEDKLKAHGYSVIILNTNEDEKEEYAAIVTALAKRVDGILFCPAQHSKNNLEFLSESGTDYLLIGRYFSDVETDYVAADDYYGGYLAGKYLIEKGKKNPLYIGAYRYIEASEKRFLGLSQAFSEEGITLGDDRFVEISPRSDIPSEVLGTINSHSIEYDSIVAFSDLLAFEIMSLSSQSELSIVGFDGIASHLRLPVKSVSVAMSGDGWASTAVEFLLRKINGEKSLLQKTITVELREFNQ